jgi:hypothetical protein
MLLSTAQAADFIWLLLDFFFLEKFLVEDFLAEASFLELFFLPGPAFICLTFFFFVALGVPLALPMDSLDAAGTALAGVGPREDVEALGVFRGVLARSSLPDFAKERASIVLRNPGVQRCADKK